MVENFDVFLHSFQVKRSDLNDLVVVKFAELEYAKSYEIKNISGNDYVILDCLELRKYLKK